MSESSFLDDCYSHKVVLLDKDEKVIDKRGFFCFDDAFRTYVHALRPQISPQFHSVRLYGKDTDGSWIILKPDDLVGSGTRTCSFGFRN
jgi:hypothetical protein